MSNYLDPFGWKHVEQAGTNENLIEHIPVIVHVLSGIAVVGSGGIPVAVAKVSPHRIIKKMDSAGLEQFETPSKPALAPWWR